MIQNIGVFMAVEAKNHHNPSHAGYPHSEETKRLLSQQKGGYKYLLLPLYMRDPFLSPLEAVEMTGLTSKQVHRFRTDHMPAITDEERPKVLARILARRNHIRWHGFTQDELDSFAFVRGLLDRGLITEDTTYWDRLHSLHARQQIPLPEVFAQRLRSEVFLRAIQDVKEGKVGLLEQYNTVVAFVNTNEEQSQRMKEEEEFITSQVGYIFVRVFPLWQQGLSAPEIADITSFTPRQIRKTIENARHKKIPRPTVEETRARITRGVLVTGRSSSRAGDIRSAEEIIRQMETYYGRELTEIEKEKIGLSVVARQVPLDRKRVTLAQLFAASNRHIANEVHERPFLEMVYAARICRLDELEFADPAKIRASSFIEMKDVIRIYEQIDPGIFDRRKDDISFIVSNTTIPSTARKS